MGALGDLKIRPLRKEDLRAIVEIDAKIIGSGGTGGTGRGSGYWERKLDRLNVKASQVSLVAETQGGVVGFILGDISGWEFGVPDTIGWIDTIGVDPAYQKRGIATALAGQVIKNLKGVGVKAIYTLVSWNDWDLLQFFRTIGFTRGDMINLELKI